MGIEKRLKNPTLENYLKGTLLIGVAAGMIYLGAAEINKRSSSPPLSSKAYEIPAENYRNNYRATHRNNSRNAFNNNAPSGEYLKLQAQGLELIDEILPFIGIAGGAAFGLYGLSLLTNLTYKKRYF
ncbi:MAG: hypothetical protein ACP5NW_03625 [Candidatus Woesearchaeota archaeon]